MRLLLDLIPYNDTGIEGAAGSMHQFLAWGVAASGFCKCGYINFIEHDSVSFLCMLVGRRMFPHHFPTEDTTCGPLHLLSLLLGLVPLFQDFTDHRHMQQPSESEEIIASRVHERKQ